MKHSRRLISTFATVVILALVGCADQEGVEEEAADTMMADTATAGQEMAGDTLRAELTGGAEVPGPGDSDGSGTAEVVLDAQDNTVCFEIEVENIDDATAAHIHSGGADESGPPVVNFDVATNGLSGCVEADPATISSIQAAPADYYVNVHNAEYGAGAVRGQLGR